MSDENEDDEDEEKVEEVLEDGEEGGGEEEEEGRMVVQNCAEDSGKEMPTLPKHGWNTWSMENRSRMESERLDQDTGKREMQGMLSSGPWARREERKTTRGRITLQRERARVLAPDGTDLSANGHEVERR